MSERPPSIVVSDALLRTPFDDVAMGFFAAGDELSQKAALSDLATYEVRDSVRRGRRHWFLAGAALVAGLAFALLFLAHSRRRSSSAQSLAIPSAVAAVPESHATPSAAAAAPTSPVPGPAPAVAVLLPSPQHATAGAAAVGAEDAGVLPAPHPGMRGSDAERAVEACNRAASKLARPKAVAAACRAAFVLAPESADIALALARSEFEQGRSRQALRWAKQALALDANRAEAYVFLGGAEQALGRLSAARIAYRRYLQLSPKGRHAADLSAILRTL